MIGTGLPISSLKREEIYSFIFGLFVALSWAMYFFSFNLDNKYLNNTIFMTGILLLLWLSSVLVVMALIYVIKYSTKYIAKFILWLLVNVFNVDQRKIIGFDMPVNYIQYDHLDNQIAVCQINGLCILSLILSYFPLSHILNIYIPGKALTFIIVCLILNLIFFAVNVYYWITYFIIVDLIHDNIVTYFDTKKYSEFISKSVADRYDTVFNNILKKHDSLKSPENEQ